MRLQRALCVICLLASGSALQHGDVPPARAAGPTVDPLTALLLYRPDVQEELRLDDAQRAALRAIQTDAESRRKALKAMALQASPQEQAKLRRELAALPRTELTDSLRLLLDSQASRLREIHFQALGPAAAFLPDGQKALGVKPEQVEAFHQATARYRQAMFDDLRKEPLESVEADAFARLQRIHWLHKAKLERAILGRILTPEQRGQFQSWQGQPLAFAIDLFQGEPILREYKHRFLQPPPRVLEPYAVLALVQIPLIREILKLTDLESHSVLKHAHAWNQAEQEFTKSLQPLLPNDRAARLSRWIIDRRRETKRLEGELAALMGTERFGRMKEIELQLRGVGAVFGIDLKGEFRISADQHRKMLATLDAAGRAKASAGSPHDGASLMETARKQYWGMRESQEKALRELLTPAQLAKWQLRIGQPLDNPTFTMLVDAAARRYDSSSNATPTSGP